MANYLAYCPRFLDSDMLALHKDIFIGNAKVIDRGLGLQHEMQPHAATLLDSLSKNITYAELRHLANKQSVSLEQLHELLGFFVASGSLLRGRNFMQQIIALGYILRGIFYGVRDRPLLKRLPATRTNLAYAICAAGIVPILGGVGLIAIWEFLHASKEFMWASCYTFGVFWASLIIHELGHRLLLSRYGVRSIVLYGPLRVGMLHTPLPRSEDLFVALIGPLFGIVSCLIAMAVAVFAGGPTITIGACLGILLVHICSFLPWYGDGKSIWQPRRLA